MMVRGYFEKLEIYDRSKQRGRDNKRDPTKSEKESEGAMFI